MNRHNLFGHLALAIAIIILAAFIGQMRHINWHSDDRPVVRVEPQQPAAAPEDADKDDSDEAKETDKDDSEVLVRFKPGTSDETINRITAQLNNRIEDRFENIDKEEMVIADEDGLDANEVAAEYRKQPEVLYAEPNVEINLDPSDGDVGEAPDTDNDTAAPRTFNHAHPSDPMFDEQ